MKSWVLAMVVASATAANAEPVVPLYEPGTLRSIATDDPPRYQLLVAILQDAEKLGCGADLAPTLKAKFGVTFARCADALMSDPPKWRLVFRLDGTLYSALQAPHDYHHPQRD